MHFKRIAQNAHLRDAGRRGFEIVSPVQQSHAFRAIPAVPGEFERPVERRFTTAHDHQVLAGESSGVGDAVRNLPVLVGSQSIPFQQKRLEQYDATGDENRTGQKKRASRRLHAKAPVGLVVDTSDLMVR